MNPFSLYYENPIEFAICQWQPDKTRPNWLYLVYRTFVMILFLTTWILSKIQEEFHHKWFIYVTNWGYTLCTIEVTLAWLILTAWSITYITGRPEFKEKALKIYPAFWLTNTIATPLAFGITTIYWIDFWPKNLYVLDFIHHGNNSIMMFFDFWLASHGLRFAHSVYPAIFGLTYSIFTFCYYEAGGTNREESVAIYYTLDWEDHPYRTVAICLGIDCYLVSLHVLMVFLYQFRQKIATQCKMSLEVENQIAA